MRLLASSNTSAIEPAGLSSAARGSKPSMDGTTDGAGVLMGKPLESAIVQVLGDQFQGTTPFEAFRHIQTLPAHLRKRSSARYHRIARTCCCVFGGGT